jgi:hypothetical protein
VGSRKNLLKVLTNFEMYDQTGKNELKSPRSSTKFAKSLYKDNYHLSNFEASASQKPKPMEKYYEIKRGSTSSKLLRGMEFRMGASVKKVVERDIYNFWLHNKKDIKMNYDEFLNFSLEENRKCFVDIETEVKTKLKNILKKDNPHGRTSFNGISPQKFHHSCFGDQFKLLEKDQKVSFMDDLGEGTLQGLKSQPSQRRGQRSLKKKDVSQQPLRYNYSIYKRSLQNNELNEASVKYDF